MAESNNKKRYHKRVIFLAGEQEKFLNRVQKETKIKSGDLARLIGIHRRTLNDWKRGKYSISLSGLKKICKEAKISLPKNIKIKSPFWYTNKGGRCGGLAVYKKYGIIGGNPKYRKKRWHEWWEKKENLRKILFLMPYR